MYYNIVRVMSIESLMTYGGPYRKSVSIKGA